MNPTVAIITALYHRMDRVSPTEKNLSIARFETKGIPTVIIANPPNPSTMLVINVRKFVPYPKIVASGINASTIIAILKGIDIALYAVRPK